MTIRASALLVLALAAGANAAPPVTWADWVGDYTGTIAWKGCLSPGAARATLALDAIDGALVLDLTAAGGGLRAMSLVEDETGWTGQEGDVVLRVQRPRASSLRIDVQIGADCRMVGQLVRPTTKIAACDALVGWTRIEARCGKLGAPPQEDPAKLAKEKLRAKTSRCEARARTLSETLISAGCAPVPDPKALVPGLQCQALDQIVGTLQRCSKLAPGELRMVEARSNATPRSAPDAPSRAIVEDGCRVVRDELAGIALAYGCP